MPFYYMKAAGKAGPKFLDIFGSFGDSIVLVCSRRGNNVYWQQLERADGTIIPHAPVTCLPAEPFDCVKHFRGLWCQRPVACAP